MKHVTVKNLCLQVVDYSILASLFAVAALASVICAVEDRIKRRVARTEPPPRIIGVSGLWSEDLNFETPEAERAYLEQHAESRKT